MKLQLLVLACACAVACANADEEAMSLLQLGVHQQMAKPSGKGSKRKGKKAKRKRRQQTLSAEDKACFEKRAKLPPLACPSKASQQAREAGSLKRDLHDLSFHKVKKNDITGSGLVFGEVTHSAGKTIDAVVTAQNYKAAVPSKTGIRGTLGNINLAANTEATFTMTFVDADTGKKVELGDFLFSVFDLDMGGGELSTPETLTIGGFNSYFLLPIDKGGQLKVTKLPSGVASFTGTEAGNEDDNPSDPMVLSAIQAERTVNFKFGEGKSSITWKYKVGATYEDGRNFQFGGMTNLYFCKAPKVNLDFEFARVVRSNLGKQGPEFDEPEGVRYHKIAVVEDQIIDLEINALDDYQAANPKMTGKNGLFGQVNLGTPVSAESAKKNAKKKKLGKKAKLSSTGKLLREFSGESTFQFTLYLSGTNEIYTPDWLYFSMYDLDNGKNKTCPAKFQESFTVEGISNFELATPTSIIGEAQGNKYRFNSTFWSGGENNPKGPLDLDESSLPHAVTFTYRNTGQWRVGFGIGGPDSWDGRNFLFAGKSSTAACDHNTYSDVNNVDADTVEDPDEEEAEKAEEKLREKGGEVR